MTKSKFAALTAGLLARKGEAAPSAHSAFLQASAWAEAAQPLGPRLQKSGPPGDLSALIERARRPASELAPPIAAPSPASADERSAPQSIPVMRGNLLAPTFGLRGHRAPPPQAPRLSPALSDEGHRLHHRTAVTVRLDEPSYLRLKLTALRYHRTYQDILARALDAYLTALGIEKIDEQSAESWRDRLSHHHSR